MKAAGYEVINHEGVVESNSGKSVIVSISSQSACSGCHAKGSCGMLGTTGKTVEVKGSYDVRPGDVVNVLMEQSMGFTALFFGYLLPFIWLLAVLITMISLNVAELTAGLVAIGSLLPCYLVLYLFRNKLGEKFSFTIKQ